MSHSDVGICEDLRLRDVPVTRFDQQVPRIFLHLDASK